MKQNQLRRILDDDRGDLYAWLLVTVGLFALVMIFIVLSPVIIILYQSMSDATNSSVHDPNNSTFVVTARTTTTRVVTIWNYVPLFLLGGLILAGFSYSAWRAGGRYQE